MKKLVLFLIPLAIMATSCGGNSSNNETAKTKEVSQKKRPSKSTKEGMLQVISDCGITIHELLAYVEVKQQSDTYKIAYNALDVDEPANELLNSWFQEQVKSLADKGWQKKVLRDNETMFGSVYNEVILLKPKGNKAKVSYGVTLFSSYNPEIKEFKFVLSAN